MRASSDAIARPMRRAADTAPALHTTAAAGGRRDFDDSTWPVIAPTTLSSAAATGASPSTGIASTSRCRSASAASTRRGSTVVVRDALDDYAEVWVDGEICRAYGPDRRLGGRRAGTRPNRLVIGRNVKPGQQIQLAVFGMNGPISERADQLHLVARARSSISCRGSRGPVAVPPHEVNVARRAPRSRDRRHRSGQREALQARRRASSSPKGRCGCATAATCCSAIRTPTASTRTPRAARSARIPRQAAATTAADIAEYGQPGSNGLTLDAAGPAHDQRARPSSRRRASSATARVDGARGQLRRASASTARTISSTAPTARCISPIRRSACRSSTTIRARSCRSAACSARTTARSQLLDEGLKGPNGIAFSPDEKYLYVGNWDPAAQDRHALSRCAATARSVTARCSSISRSEVPGEEALDGIKVDVQRQPVSRPRPAAVDLRCRGQAPRHDHRAASRSTTSRGAATDGKTLYLCARSALYRIPLLVEGVRP